MNFRSLPRYVLFVMAMLLCAPVSAQQPGQASGNREEVITLQAILCGTGEVTDIKVKSGPADSVNAKAVEAARKIRFVPAEKNGEKA